MNFEVKIVVAISLVVIGAISAFQKVRQYRNDSRRALTEDLIDVIFFLPQLIFSMIWLALLLTHVRVTKACCISILVIVPDS
jgi:hypothetical protein